MGIISRVAGTGTIGTSGDDGPATNAQLQVPVGVAVTADGGFLIADFHNNMVRKVSAAGMITRVAGTGTVPISANLLVIDVWPAASPQRASRSLPGP